MHEEVVFGFRRCHGVTAMLFDLDVPSFATVLHKHCHFLQTIDCKL